MFRDIFQLDLDTFSRILREYSIQASPQVIVLQVMSDPGPFINLATATIYLVVDSVDAQLTVTKHGNTPVECRPTVCMTKC